MPSPYEYKQTTTTPTGEGVLVPRARPQDLFSGSGGGGYDELARGARSLAIGMKHREEEQARAWSASTLADVRLDWTQQFLDRQSSAEPGAPDFTPKLLADYEEYSSKLLDSAPTDAARAYMGERLQEFKANLGQHALAYEAQARIDHRDDQFKGATDKIAKLMSTDPTQYKPALGELLATIDASDMPQIKKSARREATVNTVSKAAALSQILKNPNEFLQSIGFYGDQAGPPEPGKTRKTSGDLKGMTGNLAFDALPFESRIQVFETAIRAKAQIDSDADSRAVAMRKKLADDTMKDGWDLWKTGKLSYGYIQSIKPVVNENDYKALIVALTTPAAGSHSDPGTLRSIYQTIDRGDFDRARQLTYSGHVNGLLKSEGSDGLTGLLGHIDTLARQGGPKTQYERSRQYIQLAMDPGPLVHDPAGKSRYAEAIDTFDNWMKTGKHADSDIQSRGYEVVRQYKFISFQDSVLQLPIPRGTKITRQIGDVPKMFDEIRQAGETLRNMKNERRLSASEFEVEMASLKRWRTAAEDAERGVNQPQ